MQAPKEKTWQSARYAVLLYIDVRSQADVSGFPQLLTAQSCLLPNLLAVNDVNNVIDSCVVWTLLTSWIPAADVVELVDTHA